MKLGSKKAPRVPKLTKHSSLKDYFMELFAARLNKCSEEELVIKSQAWGRTESEAKRDIGRVENLYDAVDIFLEKALSETVPMCNC